jgi:hypothetical protein
MLLLIIILLLVFGVGGGYYGHTRWGPAAGRYRTRDNIVDSPHRLHAWLVPLMVTIGDDRPQRHRWQSVGIGI